MTEPSLVVQGLTVRVRDRAIVDDVSFVADTGEIVAVIGPNGAGKTSLLEAIVSLRPVTTAKVSALGRSLTTFAERARTFAFLPDQAALPAEATTRTVMQHAIECRTRSDTPSESLPIDANTLRRALSLDDLENLPAGVLSRGERQRVLLFSTLVLGRPVVVLDEPFAAFDPLQLREILAVVRDVAASGTTILASIHQLVDAEKIAHRALLLAEGKAIAFGTLPALRAEAGDPNMSLEDAFVALLSRGRNAA